MVRISWVALMAIIAMVSACGGPSPGVPATAPTAVSATPVEQPRQPTRILGKVTDRAGQPLNGALIEILDGAEPGRSAVTDDSGKYEIKGSTTDFDRQFVTIRASRNGYQPRITQAWWYAADTANAEQVIWLDTGPAIVLNPGAYTVTIAFDVDRAQNWLPQAPCAGFPPALSVRRYQATVSKTESRFQNDYRGVTLQGVQFMGFGLTLAGRFVEFEFDFPIDEAVPPSGYLAITGIAPTMEPATVGGASVSIPFHGSFNYYQQVPPDHHTCESDHAIMTFTPR